MLIVTILHLFENCVTYFTHNFPALQKSHEAGLNRHSYNVLRKEIWSYILIDPHLVPLVV